MIDYSHLRNWLTGEGYPVGFHDRPVILECRRSKSGMTMGVFDRDKKIFTVRGCGFDRIGTALGEFLETLFQPALQAYVDRLIDPAMEFVPHPLPALGGGWCQHPSAPGMTWGLKRDGRKVMLEGSAGVESMIAIADAIGIHVWVHDLRNSTAIVLRKKG